MIGTISQYSHGLAAVLFGLLALWQFTRGDRQLPMVVLGFAFVLTAAWAGFAATLGPEDVLSRAGEMTRNLGFLSFMFVLLKRGQGDDRRPYVGLVYAALILFGLLQAATDLVFGILFPIPDILTTVYGASIVPQMFFAIGALLLVHILYTASAPEARWGIRLPMIALAAMWGYDLNLYTFAWLTGNPPIELLGLRGLLMICLVPSFALAMHRNSEWKMKLSRKVTFRSLSLLAIAGYFMLMYLASEAIEIFANDYTGFIQVALVFLMSAGAIILLPSQRVRDWLRVKLTKHLFEHRYDYRTEWIRFNKTLARPDEDAEPLDERVVRAIAEIAESPGGLLLVPDSNGNLTSAARWNWTTLETPHQAADDALIDWLLASAHITELEPLRRGDSSAVDEIASLIPEWMVEETRAWALVPLIHQQRLTGAVLLERPRIDRTLDWEDLDLLRIAGRQAASYLSEAKGQEALAEARRFDEFNRRFAFIMHDIKNLVSQLSLVARNAERHADNPEFHADMIATLQDSVGKMNDLLVRLAPQDRGKAAAPRPTRLRNIAQTIIVQKEASHSIELVIDEECLAMADPFRLETALTHLVQNAIDASDTETPVCIAIGRTRSEAWIAVEDSGAGMSDDFIRNHLFRPFNSSKSNGFGIGAFEARALIAEMGGRLEVDSREGEGTRFTVSLPIAIDVTDHEKEAA